MFLKANLDGLRWYLDNLINYDPTSSSKFKERLLRTNGHHSFYSHDATLSFDCILGSNTIVLDGAVIGQKAILREAVIGQQATVGDQTVIERSILGKTAKVGKGVTIKDSVVSRNCVIGNGSKIVSSVIEEGAEVKEGEKVENEVLSANGARSPYQSKASFNKFILEDELEISFEGDEDEHVEEIGS